MNTHRNFDRELNNLNNEIADSVLEDNVEQLSALQTRYRDIMTDWEKSVGI